MAVNNAWRVVSMESIEGGMYGWDDSCVTQERGGTKAERANSKYAVNANGPQRRATDTGVTESLAGRV